MLQMTYWDNVDEKCREKLEAISWRYFELLERGYAFFRDGDVNVVEWGVRWKNIRQAKQRPDKLKMKMKDEWCTRVWMRCED